MVISEEAEELLVLIEQMKIFQFNVKEEGENKEGKRRTKKREGDRGG